MRRRGTGSMAFWGEFERNIRIEWVVVVLALTLLTAVASYFGHYIGLARFDHSFYDKTLGAAVNVSRTDDIVIVAIDDGSIKEIGYWPWRRARHAQLLGRLKEAKAVGLDIIFNDSNPAYQNDDQLLAQAIQAHGRVVLPLVFDKATRTVGAPLPFLARAAKRLGRIDVHPDEDTVIRSVVLQDTLASGHTSSHFVLAMLEAGGDVALASRLEQQASGVPLLISYAGKPGSFTMYPYSRVLSGDVSVSAFSGKYVLVGSWASGLGDALPTPRSEGGVEMAGVEILANGLQNALENRWIRSPNRWQNALLAALPVLLVCLFLRRLSPRRCFFVSVLALLLIFAVNWLLMHYARVWIPPSASVIGVALTYPVWSWRSQEAALQHFDRELQKLHEERLPYTKTWVVDGAARPDGSLSARVMKLHRAISLLRQAVRQREETLRFISHDMRSPQNSILALTELQSRSRTPLVQEELLARIDQYANKTLGLVDGFVQLARAEAMDMAYSELDLADLLGTTCDERWPLAKQKNSAIVFSADVDNAYVNANAGMLARAFGNLLDNAIHYSPEGADIQCRLSGIKNYWLVAIQDQGRGISLDQQESLFTPFKRLNENASVNPAGSGLGLAFVQTVVARHGGAVTVCSIEGQGSTFTVSLPIVALPRLS